jgi:DNA-binding IscR family transcriptional regulator
VLAQLARVQIVEAREGRHSAYRLVRAANRITPAEVYKAVKSASSTEELTTGKGFLLAANLSSMNHKFLPSIL